MAHSIRFPRRHDKADRNGRYAVRLCITKNKRRKYIALDLYADPAYWDEAGEQFIILRNLKGAEQKAENKQREADNALLVKYKARAREIVERFEIEGIDWTLNQFEDAFLNTSKQGKFNAYFTDRIAELHATGHIGNSQTYKQTQDMLRSGSWINGSFPTSTCVMSGDSICFFKSGAVAATRVNSISRHYGPF